MIANEKVRDDSNKIAFEYGPIVYCAEEIDNINLSNVHLSGEFELSVEEKIILTEKVISLIGNVNGEELTLLPYYLWSNRGVGKMKVWFPRKDGK